MAIFLSYLPWIVFMSLPGAIGLRGASVAALVLCAALLGRDRARGGMKPLDAKGAAFFAVFLLASFVFPVDAVALWAQPLGSLALCLFALLTVLVGRPFTLAYAREVTRPEVWDTEAFLRANVVISLGWAAGFAVMAAGAFLEVLGGARFSSATLLASLAGMGGALAFQNVYRRLLRRRMPAE